MSPELPAEVLAVVRAALAEDAAARDVTASALVPADAVGEGEIRAKAPGVVAGLDLALAVFAAADPATQVEALVADGDQVRSGTLVCRANGTLRSLLAAERTAVNFLQRMSGIATLTARFVTAVRGTGVEILATRKTAPGLRWADLAAVRAGGGGVHRGSLSERVLVKENHLRAARAAGTCQTMADVVRRILDAGTSGPGATVDGGIAIGIEAADLGELRDALVPGVDVVLLDNFTPDLCREAVAVRARMFAADPGAWPKGPPRLEASGGITLANIGAYAATGVERVSVGALTHSAPALDLSMTVRS